MATVAPPPPPPPPPAAAPPSSCGNVAYSPPVPQHAALPFNTEPPIQETDCKWEAPHDAQGGEAPASSHEQNVTQSPPSHGHICPPVQETDPAPEALRFPVKQEQQDT